MPPPSGMPGKGCARRRGRCRPAPAPAARGCRAARPSGRPPATPRRRPATMPLSLTSPGDPAELDLRRLLPRQDDLQHDIGAGARRPAGGSAAARSGRCLWRPSTWQTRICGSAALMSSAAAMAASASSAPTPRPIFGRPRLPARPTSTATALPPAAAFGFGSLPATLRLTDCLNLAARRQRVGPRQRQRPDIGLERGVGPVAVVLHLEGVAFHAAGRPHARHHLVAERADVEEGLHRIDDGRELVLHLAAVDMDDLDRVTRPRPSADAARRSRCGW